VQFRYPEISYPDLPLQGLSIGIAESAGYFYQPFEVGRLSRFA
jgi:hypothetical protein